MSSKRLVGLALVIPTLSVLALTQPIFSAEKPAAETSTVAEKFKPSVCGVGLTRAFPHYCIW